MDPNRKRKRPDDPSNADAHSGGGARYDWRAGLAPGLRVLNRTRIAVAIQNDPDETQIHAPLILETAHKLELRFYEEATSEHDYLTRVSEYIQRIPCSQGDFQALLSEIGVGRLQQQLDPMSGQNVVIPNLNQPASSEKQKGKQPLPRGLTNSPTTGHHEPTRPVESLLERHNEVICCLQRLVLLFLKKLGLAQGQQQNSAIRQRIWQQTVSLHQKTACVDFVSGLMELKTMLKEMTLAEEQGQNQMINSLKEWYEEKIQELIKTFSMCINYKLDELNQDKLMEYQQWLLSLKPGKKYLSANSSVLADLNSLNDYSQQSQYLGLRPLYLTPQMGYWEPQYPGEEPSNVGHSSVPLEPGQHLTGILSDGNSGIILPPQQSPQQQQPG